jgi:hypothetical protein
MFALVAGPAWEAELAFSSWAVFPSSIARSEPPHMLCWSYSWSSHSLKQYLGTISRWDPIQGRVHWGLARCRYFRRRSWNQRVSSSFPTFWEAPHPQGSLARKDLLGQGFVRSGQQRRSGCPKEHNSDRLLHCALWGRIVAQIGWWRSVLESLSMLRVA